MEIEELMKDGYYWARYKDLEFNQWEIVEVWREPADSVRVDVSRLGSEVSCDLDDFEFGDKIEIPEK